MKTKQFSQMKQIKQRVKHLLESVPHLRDSDYKLIATFWWHELGKERTQLMTAFDLLEFYSKGKLTSAESIRRVRCKIMEECPELRGKTYLQRMEDGEEFRTKIKEL